MSTILDSYSEANQDANSGTIDGGGGSELQGVGQSFTPIGTATLIKATLYLKKGNFPTGNAVAKIYAHSGTYGTSSIPTGVALATSDVFDVSTLTSSYALYDFNFSGGNQISLTGGTHYVLTFEFTGGDASNAVIAGIDTSAPTGTGNYSTTLNLSTWTPSAGTDMCFYVYGNLTIIASAGFLMNFI